MNPKVTIITFTDPMMGLSYECEPIFRKLETHFEGKIEFKYLMSVLVKDVYDLVNPDDLSMSKELSIKNYNEKLAKIYESEESISGMPINMTDFHLFSVENTSSLPLNLAYKAAQLVDIQKADLFLYNLRYATIVDCRQTTKTEEILKVVRKTKINEEKFLKYFNDGSATSALETDLKFAYKLGIRTLPAYLIAYGEDGALFQELLGYEAFVEIIKKLTNGEIKTQYLEKNIENLQNLLKKHPIISPIEIREVFDFTDIDEVKEFISPLIKSKEIKIVDVEHCSKIPQLEQKLQDMMGFNFMLLTASFSASLLVQCITIEMINMAAIQKIAPESLEKFSTKFDRLSAMTFV